MAHSLCHRFIAAEEHFLSALALGPEAVASFNDTWLSLFADFASAEKLQQADEQTKAVAHATASRIAIIADQLFALNLEASDLSDDLKSCCVAIISQPGDDHHPHSSPLSASSSLSTSMDPSLNPDINSVCYHWLLHNLHDPYPSSSCKAFLARLCERSVKEIKEWFADARRRIGWTALSQEKFGGSRRAIVDAASRAYTKQDIQDGIPCDIRRAFIAIKANSSRMYNHSRALLDARAVDDLTGPPEQLLHGGVSCTVSDGAPGRECATPSMQESSQDSQPFPVSFVGGGSSASLSLDEEIEDTTPPPAIAGFKRRFEDSGDATDECPELTPSWVARHSKCSRYIRSTSEQDAQAVSTYASNQTLGLQQRTLDSCLPIFHSHVDSAVSFDSSQSPYIPTAPNPTLIGPNGSEEAMAPKPSASSSRKRRLSATNFVIPSKRPRGSPAAPRKQTVSNPMPGNFGFNAMEVLSIDGLLQGRFDVSNPVDTGDYYPSFPPDTDVAICAGTSSQCDAAPSFTGSLLPASHLDMLDADLLSATPNGFDLSVYDSNPSAAWGAGFVDSDSGSDNSSAQSPSSASSSSESSEYGLFPPANGDWTQDWSQFMNIFDSLEASPASSRSSLQDFSCAPQYSPDSDVLTNAGDVGHVLFDMDPSFTSPNLLSDIHGFSSLHMPLETLF